MNAIKITIYIHYWEITLNRASWLKYIYIYIYIYNDSRGYAYFIKYLLYFFYLNLSISSTVKTATVKREEDEVFCR